MIRATMQFRQTLWRSFQTAGCGVWGALRTERNLRIQVTVGVCVIVLGAWVGLERWEWCVVTLAIGQVLILELLNTAMEAVVDLASPDWHALAKRAKDTAAAAVLLASVVAVISGIIVFGPRLFA